ncbi:cytochrome P450 [Streptomyces sp. NPDC096311]|uniref:cytochrome P450 n=1 Tax=Streptomyces sp. NPDC096311 TaxID=3366083 RepID=UPI00382E63D2
MTTNSEPPAFPLLRPKHDRLAPPAQFADWRASEPMTRVSIGGKVYPWVVTRYEDVRTVLGHPGFSSDQNRPGFPNGAEGGNQPPGALTAIDPPTHDVMRRALTREFMVKRIERLRPAIERVTHRFLDQVAERGGGDDGVDLVENFCLPLPSLVICELLGVPYDNHDFFQKESQTLVDLRSTPEQVGAAFGALGAYLQELIQERQRVPGDDVLTTLGERATAGDITLDEARDLGAFLLLAGHETSANMLGLSALALMRNPEQTAVLLESPKSAVDAVEELMRYLSIVHGGLRRLATQDVEIGGATIRKGEGVIVPLSAANHDPEMFEEPEVLDLKRQEARRHMGFGFGIHQCLGQPLARLELQIALPALFRRFPDLRLAVPSEELTFKETAVVYGLHRLPVTW